MLGKIFKNIINRFIKADKTQPSWGLGYAQQVLEPSKCESIEPEEWPIGYSEYKIEEMAEAVPSKVELDKLDYRKFRIRAYCKLKGYKLIVEKGQYHILLPYNQFICFYEKTDLYEWIRKRED